MTAHGGSALLRDRWAESVSRFPDAPAVRDDERVLTYAKFDALQRAIGTAVAARVPANGVVGVVVPKRVWSLAAMFGVASVGRCALLLDPGEPEERWAHHCARVYARVVVAEDAAILDRAAGVGFDVLGPEALGPDALDLHAPAPDVELSENQDAWIVCTSGSTGEAKLVAIPQRMLREAWDRNVGRNALWGDIGAAVLVLPPLNTAAIRMGTFQALSAGACAVLVDTARTAPDRLLALAEEYDVRRFHLGPWLLRSLIDAAAARQRGMDTVTVIVSTGAPLMTDDVARAWEWFPNARIRSHYGSTEVAGIANVDLAPGTDLTDPNAMAAVLDHDARIRVVADGRECAPGEQGEIWVSSIHAHGVYRDAPDLEAATSVRADDALWVRTGDLGRLLADGRLLVDGRDDARVKVNGLAVDLNAVTAAVRALPGVADAEVTAIPRGDDTQLVAWVVAIEGFLSVRELRAGLASTLPRAMFPHVFRAVAKIPRLPNGKVDRMALRAAAAADLPSGAERVAPSTPNERELAALFETMLDRTDVGIHESFFELGGDSLGALELTSVIVDRFALPDARRPALESALLTEGTVAALNAVLDATAPAAVGVEEATLRPDGVGVLVLGNGPVDGVPIVLLCGGGQDPLAFRPLVRRLAGQRVWTLTPRGFRSRQRADRSVPQMAHRFADALIAKDPRGEFVVAGFSFGGMVAHELACQLTARGARVRLLAILDTPAPGSGGTAGADEREAMPRLRARWRRIPHALWWRTRWRYLGVTAGLVVRRGWVQGEAFLSRAGLLIRRFRPQPFAGPTLVVRSAGSTAAGSPPDLGWGPWLTGTVTTLDVAGNHFGTLLEPSAGTIARVLSEAART